MQTRSPIFDDIAQLLTGAAGAARGAREEIETLIRAQVERAADSLDLVSREEFDAVREMAVTALNRVEALESEIAVLKGQKGKAQTAKSAPKTAARPKPKAKPKAKTQQKSKP